MDLHWWQSPSSSFPYSLSFSFPLTRLALSFPPQQNSRAATIPIPAGGLAFAQLIVLRVQIWAPTFVFPFSLGTHVPLLLAYFSSFPFACLPTTWSTLGLIPIPLHTPIHYLTVPYLTLLYVYCVTVLGDWSALYLVFCCWLFLYTICPSHPIPSRPSRWIQTHTHLIPLIPDHPVPLGRLYSLPATYCNSL